MSRQRSLVSHDLNYYLNMKDEKLLRGQWGEWKLNRKDLTLESSLNHYCIDLHEISNSANMLDWIFQIFDKDWGKKSIYDLIDAFGSLFNPQANLCPCGKSKTINPRVIIEKEISKEAKIK